MMITGDRDEKASELELKLIREVLSKTEVLGSEFTFISGGCLEHLLY
jgi:hypothetical protein